MIDGFVSWIVCCSGMLLLWGWVGYPFWVCWLAERQKKKDSSNVSGNRRPESLSVVIAAYNEEDMIEERIRNILQVAPDGLEMEIIVVSDHSTDRTVERALSIKYQNLHVLENSGERGRASAHNLAMQHTSGELLVFTDAETRFQHGFFEALLAHFADPHVGVVTGKLEFLYDAKDGVQSASGGIYWTYEQRLLHCESQAGVMFCGSGACLAVRRNLCSQMPPHGDVDFTLPLRAIRAGYRCAYAKDALAFDHSPPNPDSEYRSRVRMVSQNLRGIIEEWSFCDWRKHKYSFAIISHKLLRWFSPYLLGGIFFGAMLKTAESPVSSWGVFFVIQAIVLGVAVYGAVAGGSNLATRLYAFLLANMAFAVGVWRGVLNQAPKSYSPTRTLG
ncbi:glycosyltransferase [Candidatus Parcubacteria bacterium]|nr:MAG: glycosyltransferase [Candidatus Parcubacteria bacterium]